MKQTSFSFFSIAMAIFVAAPLMARADTKPDFEDDAKPILSQQPGLIEYVESRFQVKDTGIAKVPGDDDHAPIPPYIFRARPLGSNGPYNLRLLIQPGTPGHILGIVQESPSTQKPPAVVAKAPVTQPAASINSTTAASQPSTLTSDTPSGPINDPGQVLSPTASNLAPPADPAPQPH